MNLLSERSREALQSPQHYENDITSSSLLLESDTVPPPGNKRRLKITHKTSFQQLAKARQFDDILRRLSADYDLDLWLPSNSLHILASCQATPECIDFLLRRIPHASGDLDVDGRTPLHLAVASGCPLRIVQQVAGVDDDPSGQANSWVGWPARVKDRYGRYPLHYACGAELHDKSGRMCNNLLGFMSSATAASEWNAVDRTPIVKLLLSLFSEAAGTQDFFGFAPIDYCQKEGDDFGLGVLLLEAMSREYYHSRGEEEPGSSVLSLSDHTSSSPRDSPSTVTTTFSSTSSKRSPRKATCQPPTRLGSFVPPSQNNDYACSIIMSPANEGNDNHVSLEKRAKDLAPLSLPRFSPRKPTFRPPSQLGSLDGSSLGPASKDLDDDDDTSVMTAKTGNGICKVRRHHHDIVFHALESTSLEESVPLDDPNNKDRECAVVVPHRPAGISKEPVQHKKKEPEDYNAKELIAKEGKDSRLSEGYDLIQVKTEAVLPESTTVSNDDSLALKDDSSLRSKERSFADWKAEMPERKERLEACIQAECRKVPASTAGRNNRHNQTDDSVKTRSTVNPRKDTSDNTPPPCEDDPLVSNGTGATVKLISPEEIHHDHGTKFKMIQKAILKENESSSSPNPPTNDFNTSAIRVNEQKMIRIEVHPEAISIPNNTPRITGSKSESMALSGSNKSIDLYLVDPPNEEPRLDQNNRSFSRDLFFL